MRRLQIIISTMLDASIKALVEGRPELAVEVTHMEEGLDRQRISGVVANRIDRIGHGCGNTLSSSVRNGGV